MTARLIAISGALKGTTFALTQDEVLIGRDLSNTVTLNDPSVSRRHCLIRKNGSSNDFHVRDLESYNGTFVNRMPVAEQALTHGDQIALGDLHFIFLTHDDTGTTTRFEDGDLVTRSTIRLEREQAFYLRPEGAVPGASVDARAIGERNALLKISTTINSIRKLHELQLRLLELTLEVVPAERGAILLADEHREDFVSCRGWDRLSGANDSIKVSQTISRQVLREVVAILSNDLIESENGGSPSLVAARVSSLLCVPLVAFDKPLGVIYLDTSSRVTRFDEAHLQLLTAIAGIAAVAFETVRGIELLEKENRRLQQEVKLEHQMVGESQSMREVYNKISKVAATATTVLILGESGTGKELAARAIHFNSERAGKPFVAINCATLTDSLVESELFGHEKGAFTGAIAQKRGKLEIADGGTIFLDEVAELSPAIQAKLLRALQTREFERVGGTRPIKVDVRTIAATNRDLDAATKNGQFREDLYYRINVVSIAMPPLRERREDIPLLAAFFLSYFSKKCKRRVTGISAEARRLMCVYDWPGNVRQLENAIEHAVVMGGTEIAPGDLPETICASTGQPSLDYHETIRNAKRQLIIKALRQTRGNYTEAAKLLGIHANNLHRHVRELGLRDSER
ncbi:MAG TPA: sigma 54-interacting transcriptional regulator [Pyrinomonadaceae bacterium]